MKPETIINKLKELITELETEKPDIKPEEPWTLPRQLPGFRALRDGEEWHFAERWKQEWLPKNTRPLLIGEDEKCGDECIFSDGATSPVFHDADTVPQSMQVPRRTSRPLPILTPEQIAEGWKEWHGGENPVPGKTVIVLFRDINQSTAAHLSAAYRWRHLDSFGDIIAYRVIEPKLVPLGPEDVRCGDEVRLRTNTTALLVQMVRHDGIDIFSKGFRDWDALHEYYEIRRLNSNTFEPCSKGAAE